MWDVFIVPLFFLTEKNGKPRMFNRPVTASQWLNRNPRPGLLVSKFCACHQCWALGLQGGGWRTPCVGSVPPVMRSHLPTAGVVTQACSLSDCFFAQISMWKTSHQAPFHSCPHFLYISILVLSTSISSLGGCPVPNPFHKGSPSNLSKMLASPFHSPAEASPVLPMG